ncbi:MAG: xanthine dehydrogenase family protein molybdopterin-binding subunit [Desulfobacterota bacterium]|nr:xanthine dehydrogenase family protein molybdopterin-binding subunit [Thermodesulfobacteriota bacterium]MDW8002699.1 xanthine dehydrogenase family protein molybdopterin-binding subunit [Deltaproteobacteria bacterium]
MKDLIMTRRTFLKTTGFVIAITLTPFGPKIINASEKKDIEKFQPTVWYEITPDNRVTIYFGNSEMGQGSMTSQPMIIADELEADWKLVTIKQKGSDDAFRNPILRAQITVASASIRGFYDVLRKAGAAGRVMLVKAASDLWKVPEEECFAKLSTVIHKKSGKKITYGKLVPYASKLPVPENPPLKDEKEFRYMGKSIRRVDIPDKVEGKAIFGLDVEVPNMLYAVVAHPPAYNAKPLLYDEKAAMAIKGVKKVLKIPQGIAVLADDFYSAYKGVEALNVKWDEGSHPHMDSPYVEKYFMECLDKPGVVAKNEGDIQRALSEAKSVYEAIYYVPHISHALMEPINITVHFQKDKCEIWAPTQSQTGTRMAASRVLGIPPEKIHVNTTFLGCGLGRKAMTDYVIEACEIAKQVDRPIKLVWTREDDIKRDWFRAATCQRIKAALDGAGNVIGWHHKVVCTSILRFYNPAAIKNGVDYFCLWGIVDSPPPPVFSSTVYEFPNFYVEQYLSELPIPAAPWRSVQNAPNAFVVECFIDELAHFVKKDPIEFRMHLLRNNPRARAVLEAVKEMAGWGRKLPKGKGIGIAQHSCFGTYVAQVAEISVDEKTGSIRVEKVCCAVDCGPCVNPQNAVSQIEGAIVLGVSTALKEEIVFEKGGVKSSNFDDYRIIRMSEVPEIKVKILDSKEKIGGIGEPGVTPVAPAIANAFFNATGVRIRRLPLSPKVVLEALKKK